MPLLAPKAQIRAAPEVEAVHFGAPSPNEPQGGHALGHRVGEVAFGGLSGIGEGLDCGEVLNQRLHAWPHRKLVEILRYKGALMGIKVYEMEERKTSVTCHACGKALPSNRRHRGLYTCSCGWRAQADVNGALKVYERAFQVSPVKGSSGRVARPVVRSFPLGRHGVREPQRKGSLLRAS